MAEFEKGDKVAWNTPQGKTTGTVKEKATGEKRVADHGQKGANGKGSADGPRYVVESGKRAAHKGDALQPK